MGAVITTMDGCLARVERKIIAVDRGEVKTINVMMVALDGRKSFGPTTPRDQVDSQARGCEAASVCKGTTHGFRLQRRTQRASLLKIRPPHLRKLVYFMIF